MATHNRFEVMAARRSEHERDRALALGAAVLAVVVLLVWPLETLLVAILAGTMMVLLEGFRAWMRFQADRIHRERLARHATMAGIAAVLVGAVAVVVWPMAMADGTLVLALFACAVSAYARWTARRAAQALPQHEAIAHAPAPAVEPVLPSEPPPAPAVKAPARRRAARRRPASPARRSRTPAPAAKRAPAKRAPAKRTRTKARARSSGRTVFQEREEAHLSRARQQCADRVPELELEGCVAVARVIGAVRGEEPLR